MQYYYSKIYNQKFLKCFNLLKKDIKTIVYTKLDCILELEIGGS